MKNLISFLTLLIFVQGYTQTKQWTNGTFINQGYYASCFGNKVDSNGNVYMLYDTTPDRFTQETMYLEKYLPNGYRDLNFGTNGVLNVAQAIGHPTTSSIPLRTFEVTDSGKVLLCVGSRDGLSPSLISILPDGTLDQSFGVGGFKKIFTDPSKYSSHSGFAYMVKSNEKYFIAHSYTSPQNAGKSVIGCFDELGNPITTMFNQGEYDVDYGSTYNSSFASELILTGPYLYFLGTGYQGNTSTSILKRMDLVSGAIDNTYPNNAHIGFVGTNTHIQPDGKIITAYSRTVSGSITELNVTRYLQNGTIDTSFGNNGIKNINYPWISINFKSINTRPNGDILIGIYYVSTASSGGKQDAFINLKSNGQLDSSFGGNIPNNGVPLAGFFGINSVYGGPSKVTLKDNYCVVSSRAEYGAYIATSRVNFSSSTLATQETYHPSPIRFYPNPVQSHGTIMMNNHHETSFNLTDASGKLLIKDQVFRNTTQVDFSDLTKGVYFLNIRQAGKQTSQKVIKE
ncbi:T9SS type A sorting domain-containing protein [Chryseobacterium sp. JK1]|uniref:T9SS type A sorting domain-containing protein n=1 Tax=Chryseobacterium sp. JK1 TaxID=874294 RepID=UPI003D69AE21